MRCAGKCKNAKCEPILGVTALETARITVDP
jgi:hypothetical protein